MTPCSSFSIVEFEQVNVSCVALISVTVPALTKEEKLSLASQVRRKNMTNGRRLLVMKNTKSTIQLKNKDCCLHIPNQSNFGKVLLLKLWLFWLIIMSFKFDELKVLKRLYKLNIINKTGLSILSWQYFKRYTKGSKI